MSNPTLWSLMPTFELSIRLDMIARQLEVHEAGVPMPMGSAPIEQLRKAQEQLRAELESRS